MKIKKNLVHFLANLITLSDSNKKKPRPKPGHLLKSHTFLLKDLSDHLEDPFVHPCSFGMYLRV